ncbi:MAG: methyltransferase domain-containing protein [Armatimonadota bacterium]|nr:methyltransferase domain-containing protein [Armatimonadota bacterium]
MMSIRAALRCIFAPQRREKLEYLDEPLVEDESIGIDELARNMRQMRRLDEVTGGVSLLLRGVEEIWRGRPALSVLDVGTGAAGVPLAIAKWAESRGVEAEIVGVDNSQKALAVAARSAEGVPRIRLVAGDARFLPFADNSFDVAVTTLTMHHLSPEDAVRLLRELRRVSRYGFVAVDLIRGQVLRILLWVLTRLSPGNRLTHHDGPVSALRAYSVEEAKQLAREAGLDARIERRLFRMTIVWRKESNE